MSAGTRLGALLHWDKASNSGENSALNSMRLALLKIKPTGSDLVRTSPLSIRGARTAEVQGADLMVTRELALMGYLPRDLLMNRGFIQRAGEKLSRSAGDLKDAPPLLVGVATPNPSDVGRPLYNSAVLLRSGEGGRSEERPVGKGCR